jgi:hypothetical protein
VLNPVCHASCLLEECSYDETGGSDPAPEHALVLPPGLDLSAVVAAGVTVSADIESVVTSTTLPTQRAACEPS